MYFPQGISNALEIVRSYKGGEVVRAQVEAAIDFFILIEPDESCINGDTQYNTHLLRFKAEVAKAKTMIRQYGTQLRPLNLDHMQEEFYSFTNSNKYRYSMQTISVARTVLSTNWNGIAGWRD